MKDISVKMKERVKLGYGFEVSLYCTPPYIYSKRIVVCKTMYTKQYVVRGGPTCVHESLQVQSIDVIAVT